MPSQIRFGYADFLENHAYPAFLEFWEVGTRLLDALNAFTLNVGKPEETHPRIVRNLCLITGMSFSDVAFLVGNGCGISAMKITRTALESAINAEYLRLNPSELKDFIDWSAVEQYRRLVYVRKYLPGAITSLNPQFIADTDKNYKAVRPYFLSRQGTMRLTWCKSNLRLRAEKAGFLKIYDDVYTSTSALSHGSLGGLAQHVETLVGDNWQPAMPPSMTLCAEALSAAHYCAFRAFQTLAELNELGSVPAVRDLKNDYNHAWSRVPSAQKIR
ncbi:MAG: DUF5677 domain-containing protein [Candidatus Acidiferrales bacterium]